MSTKINVNNAERLSSVLLGSALVSFGVMRRSGPLSLASIAGGAPLLWRGLTGNCPVYNALDINSASPEEINAKTAAQTAGVPAGKGIKVSQHITINKPASEVFRFWSNFENLPRFMDHLESVKLHQNGCSHWVAKAPLGAKVEWDAEIVDAKVNEFISWRSKPGTSVPNEGTVRFKPTATGDGTEVEVTLEYKPPAGALGATIAKLFGEEPQGQVASDLRRFKSIMETGEVPTAGGQKVAASEPPATPASPAPHSEHHADTPVGEYERQLKKEAKENKAESLDQAEVGSDLSFPASDPPTNY